MHLSISKLLGVASLWATLGSAVNIIEAVGVPVPNQYMVKLTDGIAQAAFDSAIHSVTQALVGNDRVLHQYFFSDFRGFSVAASPVAINIIKDLPGVEMVEQDQMMYQQILQNDAPYGLDRISHRRNFITAGRAPPSFSYNLPAGQGTTIYVVDSGIYINNADFGGRAIKGQNYAPNNVFNNPNTFEDFTGHGTHVASIAGGYDYGVAKYAEIVDVKVFNDNGTAPNSITTAGISWAANDAESRNITGTSVINMSFGGSANSHSTIVGFAVRSATNAGIFCVAAAGNDARNADDTTPANVPQACTVGAIDERDMQASFSNYGDSLDIWAPGVNILAAYIGGVDATHYLNGTSMAAPFVSGVGAYLKSNYPQYRTYTPTAFCQQLMTIGNKNDITFFGSSMPPGPNIILYDAVNT